MDYLIKALALNNQVRVYLVQNKEVVNEAIKRHDLWPSASSVLGKTLTMGLIMGAMLKGNEGITIKINGNGPLGNIIVDANAHGEVKGYVDHPHVSIVKNEGGFDDALAIGTDGYLDVIKDLKLKEPFTSSIALSGDLAYDFTYYFLESEQTRSALSLGILIDVDNTCKVSGGIIFQLLPNASDEVVDILERKLREIEPMSKMLQNYSIDEIIKILFDKDYIILDKLDVFFKCDCSKERFSRGLVTLGVDDLEELLHKDKQIETVCHFCQERYVFNEEEIENLIKEIKK
ncbi:MAG TPA: Hsp33 family molecular chaperone HslO [Acholeplasmataceae bacterium]|jgi:molecular chaperone Hsp33|nr:Hsp33 family molecular chaperone HslO [Acholeplasmataceae bacterium]